jgi:hypothetical protein
MDQDRNCPKCGSLMEIGFTLDVGHGSFLPSIWVQGFPEGSFWTITKIGGKTKLRVDSYRCTHCGFLESYALEPWKLAYPV